MDLECTFRKYAGANVGNLRRWFDRKQEYTVNTYWPVIYMKRWELPRTLR